jgi:hypothetical protein
MKITLGKKKKKTPNVPNFFVGKQQNLLGGKRKT